MPQPDIDPVDLGDASEVVLWARPSALNKCRRLGSRTRTCYASAAGENGGCFMSALGCEPVKHSPEVIRPNHAVKEWELSRTGLFPLAGRAAQLAMSMG